MNIGSKVASAVQSCLAVGTEARRLQGSDHCQGRMWIESSICNVMADLSVTFEEIKVYS